MNNEPAFPLPRDAEMVGMTLRDYFAAAYLSGRTSKEHDYPWEEQAKIAYAVADEMLKQREL